MRLSKTKTMSFVGCALAALLAVAGQVSVHAGSGNSYEDNYPDSVYDFYQLLPNDYFFDEHPTKTDRLEMLVEEKENILDNSNDYLYVRGGDGQWDIQMALFRYHGIITVAIASGSYDPDIPQLEFKRYRNGKWIVVTKRVLSPRLVKAITNESDDAYDNSGRNDLLTTFSLPEHGTTIVVHTRPGKDLKLSWFKGRFVVVH
jgi:hypothetical protein